MNIYRRERKNGSRIPEDVRVTAIQWRILYFLVSHMTINKTRLNNFAEGQTRRKHPPFTFIPALAQRYRENCQIVTENIHKWYHFSLSATIICYLHTKTPGWKVGNFVMWISCIMNKSTNESNYLFQETHFTVKVKTKA